MDPDNQPAGDEPTQDEPGQRSFRIPGLSLALFALLVAGALLAFDLQDVFMAESRQKEVLALVENRKGDRLTQIERDLNDAHLFTRYSDEPFPWLRVSTLNRIPAVYRLIRAIAPENNYYKSISDNLTNATTIILLADKSGNYVHELTGDYSQNVRLIETTSLRK